MAFRSTRADNQTCSLTVYNNGFAVVKEKRWMELGEQDYEIHYLDVASQMETDSLLIDGVTVQELNYEHDGFKVEKLLEKYLNQTIYIFDQKREEKTAYRLLNIADGIVVENVKSKEIVLNPSGEMILPRLTSLPIRPGLIWRITDPKPTEVSVSYLSKGFSWTVDYVMQLGEQVLDLSGWANLKNESGVNVVDANLKLIAGDVQRVNDAPPAPQPYAGWDGGSLARAAGQAAQPVEEKSFHDYHLYTYDHQTTLNHLQTKQLSLFQFQDIPCRKVYENRYGEQVTIHLAFKNQSAHGLGIPLPKGKIKIYAKDPSDQTYELIGEDLMTHTAKDEQVELTVGNAFDVICEEEEVEHYEKLGYQYVSYTYAIRNHKQEAIDFRLIRSIYGSNFKIVKSNQEYQISEGEVTFPLKLQADEEQQVTFTYRFKW